jgi:hypothetical protein
LFLFFSLFSKFLRLTNFLKNSILETYYQAGLEQPTEDQITEILEKIGREGESGLTLSKNIIILWFVTRRGQPKKYVNFLIFDSQKLN